MGKKADRAVLVGTVILGVLAAAAGTPSKEVTSEALLRQRLRRDLVEARARLEQFRSELARAELYLPAGAEARYIRAKVLETELQVSDLQRRLYWA